MTWTIFVILLTLWFLGVASSCTFGGLIHVLLLFSVAAVVAIRFFPGRLVD